MNEGLADLVTGTQGMLLAGFVVFLRVGAVMALMPAFGERVVPARVRLAAALCFTAVVTPAVAAELPPVAANLGTLLAAFGTEPMVGLTLGIFLRLFVQALEMAGTMAAQSTSLSQLFGAGGEPMPAMSHLFLYAGLALAMLMGLHVRAAELMILSYDILPAGHLPGGDMVREWGVGQVARVFALAFSLAGPFVIAAVIYNVALGAINRAMPQLMVALVGAPAISLGALALLAVAGPSALALWYGALDAALVDPFGAPG